ncbi:MAG: diaminopimelate decarboxylase [Candidatus Bilamarchaeum sp.]
MADFFTTGLSEKAGKLFIGDIAVNELCEKFGTPLYVINQKRIEENYQRIKNAFSNNYKNIKVHYAMKANSNLNVLEILKDLGAKIDAVSEGEVRAALKAGFSKGDIFYTGSGIDKVELDFLLKNDIRINLDSISDLEKIDNIKIPEFISFRINPETGSGHHSHVVTGGKDTKFGIWEQEAIEAYKKAKKIGVKKFGIHMHIGSNIFDTAEFCKAIDRFMEIASNISKNAKIEFELFDIGGGFGVPYRPDQDELDIEKHAKTVVSRFREKLEQYELGQPALLIEPGRYIVADAAVLLTKVSTIKKTPYKKFAFVDAGMNTLIRPAMYESYHHIVIDGKINQKPTQKYDVVGPICESGDVFAKDRMLPQIEEDDIVAILTAGAYGQTMSSNYNLRPRAAEVIISKGKYMTVRERERIDFLVSENELQFFKYHGLGNDFVVLEDFELDKPKSKEFVTAICDRHFGIGADGVIYIQKVKRNYKMHIINSDGSVASMCGNGIRAVAKHLYDFNYIKEKKFQIDTDAGIKSVEILDDKIRVDMGKPQFLGNKNLEGEDLTLVSMGNPHAIIFKQKIDMNEVLEKGPKIENDKYFKDRTNVEFVRRINQGKLEVVVYERGSGLTLACGTGACASVYAAIKNGLLSYGNNITVVLPGGELDIFIEKEKSNIYMDGEAKLVFSGKLKTKPNKM